MKKYLIFLLAATALILWLLAADWQPAPPNASFFVRDEAGLLSHSARMEIAASAAALAERTGLNFVVVSIGELDGQSASKYGRNLLLSEEISGTDGTQGVVLLMDAVHGEAWVTTNPPLRELLVDRNGESLTATFELGNGSSKVLVRYRMVLARLITAQGISSLPRYGALEKTVALSRAELCVALAALVLFVLLTNWVKRRFYPPHYPLEKEGPFQPAHVPDLLNHRPR